MSAKTTAVPEQYAAGWLDQLDGRLAIAKDVRGRYDALTQDLGGVDTLSYQQRSLVERAVWLEFWLARQERELAGGGELNVGQWVQANNALLGLYRHVGLERRARPVESLQDYVRRVAAESGGGTSVTG